MHVQIILDQPHTTWTNLDFITGKVFLRLNSQTNITSITVKLEGESRTRLLPPADLNGNVDKAKEEIHKILYKIATVFPLDTDLSLDNFRSPRNFVLNPGSYEYPFRFKFPFNNNCVANTGSLNLSNLRLETRAPTRHAKATLPPTLTAFPGLAEIRYFLKVTVKRKEFYKENPRVLQFFNFLPIEPPRQPNRASAEVYARRQHEFMPPGSGKGKLSLLGRRRPQPDNSLAGPEGLPKIRVDFRLPSPAILTCNQPIPLRLIVTRQNQSSIPLFIESLQITLIGYTHIRAHEVLRDETLTWVIMSASNMHIPLRASQDKNNAQTGAEEEELVVDDKLWKGCALPSSVAPTFETCNILRRYELEINIGIGYGPDAARNMTILPLRHKVNVYSGIKPPPTLLAAMSTRVPNRKPLTPTAAGRLSGEHSPAGPSSSGSAAPGRPSTTAPRPSLAPQSQPASLAPPPGFAPLPQGWGEGIEDPPPSYEDAIADDMPSIEGPRADYEPPAMPAGAQSRDWESNRKGSR